MSEGFSYDFGAHFITNRLAAAIGVGAMCRDVQYYGETVLLNGKVYPYPFGLIRSPGFAFSALATRAGAMLRKPQVESAADWFRLSYGRKLADAVAIPLVEAWSGARGRRPGARGRREVRTRHRVTSSISGWPRRVLGRAVANGYCREQPESVHVWHVYPEGGVGHALPAPGGRTRLRARARSRRSRRFWWIRAGSWASGSKGEEHEADAVVSTAPVHILSQPGRGHRRAAAAGALPLPPDGVRQPAASRGAGCCPMSCCGPRAASIPSSGSPRRPAACRGSRRRARR